MSWATFACVALCAAIGVVFAFKYLSAHYEDLQEPWFFMALLMAFSFSVSVAAALFNETLHNRSEG